jgi:DNA-binding Xre family transcriptional regulator
MDEFVYAFCSHGDPQYIKIGRTTDLEQRLAQLRVGTPFVSEFSATFPCENATWMEHALHVLFKKKKVRGEWYEVSSQEFLDACKMLEVGYGAIMQREHITTAISMRRRELKLSQVQLAEKAGIRQATVSKAENCEDLHLDTVAKIATALGCEIVMVPLA